MYGDYSRGHQPDVKRGRYYRRVLLQMGRPVLDSDGASMVDALLGEVRAATRGLGCAAGSPDLGFLVTPGRLLSVFAEAHDRLTVTQGTPDAWLDYRYRFAGRYPALHVAGTGGPARVTVPLLQPIVPATPTRVALWARVEEPTTIQVNGIPVSLTPGSPDEPERVELATGGASLDPLEIAVDADEEVWLFLLEQDEAAGDEAGFWVAPGTYHVDGLVAHARGGGRFPSFTFPDEAGFPWTESPDAAPPLGGLLPPAGLAAGTRLVAYLETWERHVTAVEDPGIREQALGSSDTSARTALLGQVKLAAVTGGAPTPEALRAAFDSVEVSGGRLTIDVPETTPSTDPCELPEVAGYSGSENRLYRIEVHEGGGLSQVRLKWSRDNGSELFAARLDANDNLVFDPGTPLTSGDVVEVLSHVVDLGDAVRATVSAGGFVPAQRAVGQLVQLVAVDVASSADELVFRLVDPDDIAVPVALDERYGGTDDSVLKLRRWHGILDPQQIAGGGAASTGPHVLEEGIGVELSATGSYRPGQYWQYEARVHRQNANGEWRPAPHGPERRFAPLALLEFQGAAEPLRLVAWLDERFSRLCDLNADDVAFAGGRVGTESDTVQEALEEIYERLPPIETWPTVAAGGINWENDRELALASFQTGLQVTFSEEMHPASASPDTFVVSLEVPADEDGAGGLRRSLIVNGHVEVAGPTWTFVPSNVDADDIGRWVRDLGGPVRCRVRLASAVILDRAGERPLDGDAFGAISQEGYDAFVDLRLPSGDGERGGDFESWFYLTGPAPLVSIDHVNPADGVHFALGSGPRAIILGFSDNVRFSSITAENLTVTVRHSSQPEDAAKPVPGTIEPYPFEVEPDVVSRVTFAPDDVEAFQPTQSPAAGAWEFTVRARGTGDNPIVDVDDRPLDGKKIETASDFVSRFFVDTPGP
ncbi:MAG: DUF6519 domain-containing protein [Actinomycetota bacterium]|nr:DUF6519 domain-containing protein [Actinomycetota bacterium]